MFYSEVLLAREGPLARVWLAANMERKLSKNNILQSNIPKNVNTIVAKDQAPIALRLSGQLLLGVVRIYSRKARYLLEDCNEALLKIKMAFKPGNVDMPANQTHVASRETLMLPDQLTDMDLLAPPPDPDFLLSQPTRDDMGAAQDNNFMNYSSQILSGSIEEPTEEAVEALGLDDDIELNLGEGDFLEGTSIEQPRNAALERNASEEFGNTPKPLEVDDIDLNLGGGDFIGEDTSLFQGALNRNDPETPNTPHFPDLGTDIDRRQRDTLSPLSSIRSSVERELEKTVHGDQNNTTFEPHDDEDETIHQQAHKAKRRKILHADADTELRSAEIRAQQNDRSKILKAASFLPRDPMLLALMTMQKTGGFVSSILGEGRSRGWAPELRGILSLEVVKRSGELKRKRRNDDDDAPVDINLDNNNKTIVGNSDNINSEMIELPEDAPAPPPLDLEEEAFSPIPDNFDDTTAPLLHPADSGPISLGTKHAVHLLRERFGPAAADDEAERKNAKVLFQDMLPEQVTTKADATRMFFEMLVLATKDAIKVEQPVDQLGGPLHLRAKRGLWGDWAEAEAGGEIAQRAEVAA